MQGETMASNETESHLRFHVPSFMLHTEISCSKWQHRAEHMQDDRPTASAAAAAGNAKPYLECCSTELALWDTGQVRAGLEGQKDKISQKERNRREMATRPTAAEYLLNEEAMLCYSKRIRGLSCPNSAPTIMGSLINVMHFCQVNGAW